MTATRVERRLARTVTLAPPEPGFGGAGHEAVFVLTPGNFAEHDPFILLADDRLDMAPGATVGSEHPHAGFEIATLVVQGSIDEGDEGTLEEGDLLWTTAGRGLVHGEHAEPNGPTRIFQLWFALPERDRWIAPHFEVTRRNDAPLNTAPGAQARLYSGSAGAAQPGRQNQVPITLVDFTLKPGATIDQELPARQNGFLYVIEGELTIGPEAWIEQGQVGWLDRSNQDGPSGFRLTAGTSGARAVLYAGEPQGYQIVTQGPFVGGSRADLLRMSREYLAGQYVRMSDLIAGQIKA